MSRARVLFLCIGNSCRSQMAEGFARAYGSDVMEPLSAGLFPASVVAPLTKKVMLAKNIDLSQASPKSLSEIALDGVDIIVNMSGQKLAAGPSATVEEWTVRDPIGEKESVYEDVAGDIERRVMSLILTLRKRESGFDAPRRRPG